MPLKDKVRITILMFTNYNEASKKMLHIKYTSIEHSEKVLTDEDTSHLFHWTQSSIISHETLRNTIHRHSQGDAQSDILSLLYVKRPFT